MYPRPGTLPFLMVVMLVCVTASAAEPESVSTRKEVSTPSKPLDLRTPDITKILSAEELDRLVRGTIDQDIEEVKVEGVRELSPPDTPVVWPGFLAPLWALAHPTQAWRIFAPLPPDQVKDRRN